MKKMIKSKLKLAAKITLIALVAVMFFTVVYVMVCNLRGKVASIGGYSVMKVVTGSMEPSIHVGDYILIRETDAEDLKVGDVITFLSDDPTIKDMPNSHRITKINDDGTFTVKGDANPTEDVYTVKSDRIIGKYVRKLWLFRFIGSFGSSKKLLMILFILPTVCICIYESRSLVKIIKGKDKDDDEQDETDEINSGDKKLTAEEQKEKLIREAIEKEKQRLRELDKQTESEVVESESGKDNET
ncbi:MAG: signal peptidase I [Ruminococcus sp.]|nr:signal peptidase I [Ruminococcus sp.]